MISAEENQNDQKVVIQPALGELFGRQLNTSRLIDSMTGLFVDAPFISISPDGGQVFWIGRFVLNFHAQAANQLTSTILTSPK